jgi:hypothetical protein
MLKIGLKIFLLRKIWNLSLKALMNFGKGVRNAEFHYNNIHYFDKIRERRAKSDDPGEVEIPDEVLD